MLLLEDPLVAPRPEEAEDAFAISRPNSDGNANSSSKTNGSNNKTNGSNNSKLIDAGGEKRTMSFETEGQHFYKKFKGCVCSFRPYLYPFLSTSLPLYHSPSYVSSLYLLPYIRLASGWCSCALRLGLVCICDISLAGV